MRPDVTNVSGAHSIATDGNEEELPLLQKCLGVVSKSRLWDIMDFLIKILQPRKCHFCASSLHLKLRREFFNCPVERLFVLFRRPSNRCFNQLQAVHKVAFTCQNT